MKVIKFIVAPDPTYDDFRWQEQDLKINLVTFAITCKYKYTCGFDAPTYEHLCICL